MCEVYCHLFTLLYQGSHPPGTQSWVHGWGSCCLTQGSVWWFSQFRVELFSLVLKWVGMPLVCKLFLLQRMFLAPHSYVEALEQGHSGEATNLNLLSHPFPCCLGIHDEVIPIAVFDLRFVSLLWLQTLSLRSIQMVHKVMSQRRCQVLICLQNFFRILALNIAYFQWKLLELPVLTPHISCMMNVAHLQTLHAWIQSQDLCLTNSLVLGRQKIHCLVSWCSNNQVFLNFWTTKIGQYMGCWG